MVNWPKILYGGLTLAFIAVLIIAILGYFSVVDWYGTNKVALIFIAIANGALAVWFGLEFKAQFNNAPKQE